MAVDLSMFDDEFDKTVLPDFDRIPDGRYQAYVDRVAVEVNDYGEPRLVIELVIVSGPQEGRRAFYSSTFTDKRLHYIKKDLTILGICPPKLSRLEEYLPQALDLVCDVTIKTSKPTDEGKTYQNTYINKVVGSRSALTSDRAADRVPF